MPMTSFSSRQFNQDLGKVKKAANTGPVFVTDRGRPAHVLMTYADYKKITATKTRIADLLAMPERDAEIELVIEPSKDLIKAVDFD